MKKGNIVKRKDGKPFLSSGSHKLNPAYLSKIRNIEGNKIWVEYKLGWLPSEMLVRI